VVEVGENKYLNYKTEYKMSRASEVLGRIKEVSESTDREHQQLEKGLATLSKILQAKFDELPVELADRLTNNLDPEMVTFIDNMLSGSNKFSSSALTRILDDISRRHGTEPSAAIDGANFLISMAIRKYK